MGGGAADAEAQPPTAAHDPRRGLHQRRERLRGGQAYRDPHRAELDNHVLPLESDGGIFDPAGFGFTGPDSARRTVSAIAGLLRLIGAYSFRRPAAGRTSSLRAARPTCR